MARSGAGARGRKRLSRSGDFDRVYREGSSRSNRFLVLYDFPRKSEGSEERRLGVSVGRKVGGAVERNRVKRVLREAFWELSGELPDSRDYVLVARAEAARLVEDEGKQGVVRSIEEILTTAVEAERST